MNHTNSSISNSRFQLFHLKKLVKRLALFSIPFLLGALFITLVDPYDFLNISSAVPEEIKQKIAGQFNPCFWKLNKFEQNPNPYVIIGDSRVASFDTEMIKEVSGKKYTNLGYGGASLREVIETFWIISKQTKLKEVYIGVDLTNYNDYEITNRAELYKVTRENPAFYFVNRGVWEAAYYDLNTFLLKEEFTVGVPDMARDEFWKESIAIRKKYFDKYAEPKNYRKEFEKIAQYCRKNDIKLEFIIFPTHVEIQEVIVEENFSKWADNMRSDLIQWGRVYDFDWENDLTKDRENFDDPVHINLENRKIVAEGIWGGDRRFVKILSK